MHLSVVLSTYNAPEWLEKVLWGYRCQRYRDFEVVVADDGSTDETRQLLDDVRRTGLAIQHVWQEDDGFQKSRILNLATMQARYRYLVFSDGDCIPRADFLEVHARLARRGRFLSGGYVKLPMDVSRALTRDDVESGRAFSLRWLRRRGARGARRMSKLAVPPGLGATADFLTTTRPSWNGHNASGWKEDIVAVNGFDERMRYGGQDRELGERLENAGIRGLQIRHRALCVHLDHARGYARMESIRKNKDIRRRTREERRVWTLHGIDKGTPPSP